MTTTREMIKAGADRLRLLIDAETGSEYAAEEVYKAMVLAQERQTAPTPVRQDKA